jgi:putative SOS response-associated peptidase YedK
MTPSARTSRRYAIVDGMNVRDSRVRNCPPRWNGAPSQDLLVIRRNHKTGEVSLDPLRWGLISCFIAETPSSKAMSMLLPAPRAS